MDPRREQEQEQRVELPRVPMSVDEFCEFTRGKGEGSYYYGDYKHQVSLLNDYYGGLTQSVGINAVAGMDVTMDLNRINASRHDAQEALRRRMKKHYNLRSKYDSNGQLRTTTQH